MSNLSHTYPGQTEPFSELGKPFCDAAGGGGGIAAQECF